MARPLRIEYPGALYHITSRGDRLENIYEEDNDYRLFLRTLNHVCTRYNWCCHSYCLMTNHYHLMIETPDANLSKGMRQLNGLYTQRFNQCHQRVGHVFQGRYKAIHVEKDSYLLQLSRYIVLNPVRANMVPFPRQWIWSSYRATVGEIVAPPWLTTEWVLSQFGTHLKAAQQAYRLFVLNDEEQRSPWSALKHQVFLGGEKFVSAIHKKITTDSPLNEIPRVQRAINAKPLSYYKKRYRDSKRAMVEAYLSGHYSQGKIADYFQVHYSTVSRAVKSQEC
ncbi:MAG: addiction module toxin RelE [Gammaproteobacteria bacterium]|nr:addiction module toxin RelE [Gammaproteobacteria bacterium]